MAMSRKHFLALAKAINEAKPEAKPGQSPDELWALRGAWWATASAVAAVCQQENPAFSRDRFYTACHGERN